jgi:hypothetical protein
MALILAQGVASVVEAMDGETLATAEESRDMEEGNQVMDGENPTTHPTDQVLHVTTDRLHSARTTTAPAPPTLARNASIPLHNTWLAERRSSQVENWHLQA